MRGQHSTPLGAAEVSVRGEVQLGGEESEYVPGEDTWTCVCVCVCVCVCDNPSFFVVCH